MAAEATGDCTYLGPPSSCASAIASLAASVRQWFAQHLGQPTVAQRLAWPVLADGHNLLLAAPTGSGKTLAAFLPILSSLLAAPMGGQLRCLYVAPLRALIRDARRNLKAVVRALPRHATDDRRRLRVAIRTGDTPARARRLLQLHPPDILLTTPESLALLLSQPSAADLFAELRWLVVDEVHALAACKRGADLALSVERLELLSPAPLQRVGLSATCAPLPVAAGFLVGAQRSCAVGVVAETAPLHLAIEPLPVHGAGFLRAVLDRLEAELAGHRTTLVFANARGLAERLTWALRRRLPELAEQIGVHHSSLSAARRRSVEHNLKEGRLRVVVSSTSLELGIDVGSVDSVVLVHPPGGVVRLLQRLGRSGHAPNRPRQGRVLTTTAAELLEAAVTGAGGLSAQYEPLRVPAWPLDVLCQQLLGMAAQDAFTADDGFDLVRRAYPYRDLPRREFDDCLAYLAGERDGQSWLPARLRRHGDAWRLADARTARLLRRNIGTILAEQGRPVRLMDAESGTLGQVDEPFADRLQPGDRFVLDGRCLEYRRAEEGALLVEEAGDQPRTPRWQGTGWPLSTELAERLYLLRLRAAEALREGRATLATLLRAEYGLDDPATAVLVDFFERQECVSEIPDARTCLVEVVAHDWGADHYLHTPLNRAGNDALARVAVLRLVQRHGRSATSLVADLGFLLSVGGEPLVPVVMRDLLSAERFDADLSDAVAGSWSLRERFRCVALTGLMLLRHPLGGKRRVGGPDWAERRLFDRVRAIDPNFVLLRQARREVFTDLLDADIARSYLGELPHKEMHWRWLADVSPFADGWTQLGVGAAESVEAPAEALQRLHAELIGSVEV